MSTTTDAAQKPPKCPYCGSIERHAGMCPTIKAIEYHPDGTTKRVEFKSSSDYGSPRSIFETVFGTHS